MKRASGTMDRERLKQIIIEEIVRAIGELPPQNAGAPSPMPPTGSWPSESSGLESGVKPGIVLFTGIRLPEDGVLDALGALPLHGYAVEAVCSFSFRQALASGSSDALRGLTMAAHPDDEIALERKIRSARWMVAVDASPNTLHKVELGIEDSVPSRAIAQALRTGLGLVLLESRVAPLRGPEAVRAELVRKLAVRGAVRATPEELPAALHRVTLPADADHYKPPAPRPEVRLRVLTREDVFAAATRGMTEFVVPAGAIVTSEAVEDAVRRGMTVRREDE